MRFIETEACACSDQDAIGAVGPIHAKPATAGEFVILQAGDRTSPALFPAACDERQPVAVMECKFDHDVWCAGNKGTVVEVFSADGPRDDGFAVREPPCEQRLNDSVPHAL